MAGIRGGVSFGRYATRATAAAEIEIFEGNMAELRANEIEELSSEDEVEDDE